ncbi:LytTR family DNA-binding domain-containing protein [Roseisolibacter sp. H3M3-2]|uniref:LytR/AlgR family response regulator transcription factor n=1 Tax=Roseisolibacter sp. H3M3-2 TaxID=3031323 RepID=UPI0023DCBC70|nr:LytTR family DNA-binding domain-containing protein [Roseisolibacter sp. H3M3-2]MDF1506280.1 LytTR family DNA-binding domain-containing protein [Roseisolibacter sp. H3M3-2]
MTRTAVVVDDEPLARERLRRLLARHPDWRVAAECADGDAALAAAARERPDVVFLDISMPGRSGVEVAQALVDRDDALAIVFVTAHDEFALAAFEVSALDYLVKPVDRERFAAALARVERRLGLPAPAPLAAELRAVLAELTELRAGAERPRRFVVRGARGHYFVPVEDVETAVAEGNYVALGDGQRSHLVRETMKSLEQKVDPARFVRIHRSAIVNVDRIARVEPLGHGEYRVTMRSGARFESSRAYGDRIKALLG